MKMLGLFFPFDSKGNIISPMEPKLFFRGLINLDNISPMTFRQSTPSPTQKDPKIMTTLKPSKKYDPRFLSALVLLREKGTIYYDCGSRKEADSLRLTFYRLKRVLREEKSHYSDIADKMVIRIDGYRVMLSYGEEGRFGKVLDNPRTDATAEEKQELAIAQAMRQLSRTRLDKEREGKK